MLLLIVGGMLLMLEVLRHDDGRGGSDVAVRTTHSSVSRRNVLRKRKVGSSIRRCAESVPVRVDGRRTRGKGVPSVVVLRCSDRSSDRPVRRHGVALREESRIVCDRIRTVRVERRRRSERTLRISLHWRRRIVGNRLVRRVGRVLLLRELGIG